MPEHEPVWHPEVLPQGWAKAADDLAARSALDGFYLAGGTALALRLGHRRSVDLDLFRESEFALAEWQNRLSGLADLRIRQAVRGTLHLVLHGTSVSFLHFPYPLLFPLTRFETLAVADPRDLACMKLNAIATRGNRRDFVDLYVTAQEYGLAQILRWFEEKFRGTPFNRVHLYKALTYFAEAEAQPMPDMLVPLEWATVRKFFVAEVPRVARLL